jgi:DNA-directed RNA polymerase alpha subunit
MKCKACDIEMDLTTCYVCTSCANAMDMGKTPIETILFDLLNSVKDQTAQLNRLEKVLDAELAAIYKENYAATPRDLGIIQTNLNLNIHQLGLPSRARHGLESLRITTVKELMAFSEKDLKKIKNFGRHSLAEVRDRLYNIGLRLRKN